jgi:uncharacterized protein (TIGR02145 family)
MLKRITMSRLSSLAAWIGILICSSAFSQVPEFLDYQSVIRDYNGELLANRQVGIRIQIKQGTAFGVAVYVETHESETSDDGLVRLLIGSGTQVQGTFAEIHWENGPCFLQTEIDPAGGSDYTIIGVSQLLTVPLAQYAKTADKITSLVPETDPLFSVSVAKGINSADTARWNNKLDHEKQGLYEVLNNGNDGRGLVISNLAVPSDYQDAGTKAYVDEVMASAGRVEEMLNNAGLYIIKVPDSTDHSEKPFVLTRDVMDIFFRTASGGGIIGQFDGPAITAKGICWGNNPAPDTSDFKTYDGYGSNDFSSKMTGLLPDTRYFVRAYALNRSGISYGEEISFTTPREPPYGIVADNEGHLYQTVVIGEQVWMAENLVTAFYSNGDPIPNDLNDWNWSDLTTGAWCDYRNLPSYSKVYGKLYNWYAVSDSRNVCPTGWHVPSNNDFIVLSDYLGSPQIAGGKLKETGTEHWMSPNTGATNETGFGFLPSPERFGTGSYVYEFSRRIGYLWASTSAYRTIAWAWFVFNDSKVISSSSMDRTYGFPVRCLKD